MHSSVIVIRGAYFGAQKRRKYAKNVGVSRSEFMTGTGVKQLPDTQVNFLLI